MSSWGRIGYAFNSGINNVVKDYSLKDATKNIAQAKGDAYAKAVKGGLITAGRVGRVAAKAIPVAGWFSTASDVRKFASGFVTDWMMYGVRKGNFDFANV